MTEWVRHFVLTLSLLLIAVPALAQEVLFYVPVPPDLAAFVTAHMRVKLPKDLTIGVIDNDSPLFEHEPDWAQGISVTAAGAEIGGQIYLPVRSAVHLQEDAYRAVVIHELVHVAQDIAKRRFACAGQREAEAYRLQDIYLLQQDLPPTNDADTLAGLQKCGDS